MLYIVVALKAEAQAFVDKYKLTKSTLANSTIYSNSSMRLIISQMGTQNARSATQTLINQFDITDDDIYLNIGICGANDSYEIGTLLEIGSITYNGISYEFKAKRKTITCVESEVSESNYEIVDMESYGFYDAVIHNPAIKNFHILKVVSDHFEPEKVTKDGSKQLIFNTLDAINSLLTKENP